MLKRFLLFSCLLLLIPGLSKAQGQFSGGGSNNGGSPTGAAGVGTFVWSTSCGSGATNCFQGTDDDATDNCGTALTSFIAAINAYSGPGTPQLIIQGSGIGKAYLVQSCQLIFTVPVSIHLWGSLDAGTNSSANLIQLGPSGLVAFSNTQLPPYRVDGNGTIVGGASLTAAGIEVEPYISSPQISDVAFVNFGAGNATAGNCTNYAIQFDQPNNEPELMNIRYWSFDSTAGRCAIFNGGAGGGSNTGRFIGLHLLATAAPGFTSPCGSQGIVEGGAATVITDGSIYGFGIPIRVQAGTGGSGNGTLIHNMNLDTAGCTAKGVSADIHYGGNGSSTSVGPLTISDNFFPNGGGHAAEFIAKAGDSTAVLNNTVISQNRAGGSGAFLFPSNTPPTCTGECYNFANVNFTPASASTSWLFTGGTVGSSQSTQSADVTAQTVLAVPFAAVYRASCYVIETRAATSSSTLPSCVITWTDFQTSTVETATVSATATGNTVGTFGQGTASFAAKAATNIQYSTTGYVSSGATTMQFTVFCRVDTLH